MKAFGVFGIVVAVALLWVGFLEWWLCNDTAMVILTLAGFAVGGLGAFLIEEAEENF